VSRFLSRVVISTAASVAALILIAGATLFLGGALYLFLVSLSITPPLAALIVGLAGFILAGLIMLAARIACRSGRATRAAGRVGLADLGLAGDLNEIAGKLGALAAQELASRTQSHPFRAFAVALMAGLAVGGSPELRDLLKDLLKD
jgi:hypothetical protein